MGDAGKRDAQRWMAEHPVGLAVAMGGSTGLLVAAGGVDAGGVALGVIATAGFGIYASLISKRAVRRRGKQQDG